MDSRAKIGVDVAIQMYVLVRALRTLPAACCLLLGARTAWGEGGAAGGAAGYARDSGCVWSDVAAEEADDRYTVIA